MKTKGCLVVLLILIFFSSRLLPQNGFRREIQNRNAQSENIVFPNKPGHVYSLVRTRDNKTKLDETDLTEKLNVIVEFKQAPLFLTKYAVRRGLSKSAFTSQFSTFRNDLIKLFGNYTRSFGISAAIPDIKYEFYRIFNGVSISLPRAVVNSLYSLPYVKKIHPDKEVSAFLNESVPLIKADSLWMQFGTGGDSIVIGILDTGVDYLHPALGGGIGPGYKVIGGYDCYNGDNDPMDDNGHGTHVAGITAADGELKGVAPKAKLMAFKVLSRSSGGMESTVIMGLERALDPNQDDNPDDMVDIANFSLGGPGYPEDAMSTTINNAVKLGLVCCVAAGNEGGGGTFNSISSPGTAELAITAGASDKYDNLEGFSSRGPNKCNACIKPDVLAPGGSILSVCLDGGYAYNSGTSMASPHVAGACALLKSIHPDWTPMDIKSALMSTAKDIHEEVMSQGAGRIDVLKAAKVSTLFNSGSLSFGLDNLKEAVWTKSDTIMVKNISTGVQKYKISFSGLFPAMHLEASPQEFSLEAGASQNVIFKLDLNNSHMPDPGTESQTFSGNVIIKSSTETLHIPWAFEKAARLVINFKPMGTRFYLSDKKHTFGSEKAVWKGSTAELIVPPGIYDFLALYTSESDTFSFIVKENLVLRGSDTLSINPEDARNKITFSVKDKDGNSFEGENSTWIYQITFPDSSAFKDIITVFSSQKRFFKCSNLSGRFKINIGGVIASNDNRVCVADFHLHEVKKSDILTNEYKDLIEENVSMDIPLNIVHPEIFFIGGLKWIDKYSVTFGGNYLESYELSGRKWKGKVYIPGHGAIHEGFQPATAISVAESGNHALLKAASDYSEVTFAVDLPPFSVYNGTVGLFTAQEPSQDILLTQAGGTISLKNWLIFPDGFHNNRNSITTEPAIMPQPNVFGQMQEHYLTLAGKVAYKIFDGNSLLFEDTLRNTPFIKASKKQYRTEFSNIHYYIEGYEASAIMNCTYDLSRIDPNPPLISSLQIRNSVGLPESRLEKGEKARVFLSGCDYLLDQDYIPYRMPLIDDSTRIFIREHGGNKWTRLNVMRIAADSFPGSYYSADISEMTNSDSTALDLKVIIFDGNLNSTECTFEPAVAIGKFRGSGNIYNMTKEAATLPSEYSLSNNYPNPFNPSTTLSFSLPEESDLKVEVFDITGRKLTILADEKRKAGTYSLQWNADKFPSGVYFCRFRAQGKRSFEKTVKMVLLR